MIRVILYIAIFIASGAGLMLSVYLKKTPSLVALISPLIATLSYACIMLGWTAYHWSLGQTWTDPPGNVYLASISNGVILLWSLVVAYIVIDRRKHQ